MTADDIFQGFCRPFGKRKKMGVVLTFPVVIGIKSALL